MNCSIVLLFLLFFGQNGRCGCGDAGGGCEAPVPPCRPRESECGCERERERECGCERERERECGCERDNDRDGCPRNNGSRFEPRFEPRPFSDAGCGCNDK